MLKVFVLPRENLRLTSSLRPTGLANSVAFWNYLWEPVELSAPTVVWFAIITHNTEALFVVD